FLFQAYDAPPMYDASLAVAGVLGLYCLCRSAAAVFDKRPDANSSTNKINRTAQWAGYAASVFSVTFFFLMMVVFELANPIVPRWVDISAISCLGLAVCSGVICLVSLFFEFLRNRLKQNQQAPRPAPLDNPHEKH